MEKHDAPSLNAYSLQIVLRVAAIDLRIYTRQLFEASSWPGCQVMMLVFYCTFISLSSLHFDVLSS